MATEAAEPLVSHRAQQCNPCHHFDDWVKHHPAIATITGLGSGALGAASFFSIGPNPVTNAFLYTSGSLLSAVSAATMFKVGQRWRHFISGQMLVPLASMAGYRHNSGLNIKTFEEKQFYKDGTTELLGELAYERIKGKEVPVLTLHSEDPFEMGLAHGYLIGKEILDLFPRLLEPLLSTIGVLMGDPSRSELVSTGETIHIPREYERELEGVLAGVIQYAHEHGLPKPRLTMEQLRRLHYFADVYKAIGCQNILGIESLNALGCSTVVIKKDDEVWLGSNMDWFSIGIMGESVFIRRYFVGDPKEWVESISLPGFIGAFRAHNEAGVKIAINECGTCRNAEGIPHVLTARKILDEAKTVADAERYFQDIHAEVGSRRKPSSTHLLIVADKTTAKLFQVTLEDDQFFNVRDLRPVSDGHSILIVTNHFVDDEHETVPDSHADGSTEERYGAIQALFTRERLEEEHPEALIKEALGEVNRVVTVISIVYSPEGVIDCAFDNYHAAAHHQGSAEHQDPPEHVVLDV